ncbi:hypothetical protein RM863_20590 [Streptomyces sp. DSM 41014]|uniref:Uncharacterized protein n=1 Tax=Streptomyces hintoniae TaxID=3075521 RepID=A0ABU2UNK7_9ACTN|nr:hypothetical protein [Streptomyces sp. DSM 41014]MDT0474526.1 hypothetical protein [Streptomyces sp. DSM 41014]
MRIRGRHPRGPAALLTCVTAALGLTAGLAQPAAAADGTPRAVTAYRHTSEAGDWVGQGGSVALTASTAAITVDGTLEDLRFQVRAGDDLWTVELAAPRGDTLRPGVYRDAERAPFRTGRSPGLDVDGQSRGCNQVYGQFSVHQIEADTAGRVTLLDAAYTQRCEAADAPALKGVVKFHALPLSFGYVSDPGDYPGQGRTNTHTGATSLFSLRPWGTGLSYDVSGKRETWNALLTPPTGETFTAGTTYPARRSSGPGFAGLDVSGSGGCNETSGTLTVTKLARDDDGAVTAFAATFVQHCEGAEPALRGTIHYYA